MLINKLPQKLHKLREILWPIYGYELKKFIPTAMLAFCILLNYGILRTLKDSLVIVSISAEAVSFIKLWGVLPAALIVMLCYAKLINLFKEERVFYIIVSIFIAYFALFQFYLRPNIAYFHPDETKIIAFAKEHPFIKHFVYIYGKWVYASFYIVAEMWGSTVLSLLFWQFANKISSTDEAKRSYPMLIFIANFSMIVSGATMKYFSSALNGYSNDDSSKYLLIIVICSAFVCMAIYRWMHLYVLTDKKLYAHASKANLSIKPDKPRLSMKESFKLILNSRYLGLLAIIVVSYGFSINLVEAPWKAKVKTLCSTEISYTHFMGNFVFLKGIISLFFVVLGSNILRKFSWLTSALVSPIAFITTGSLFFMLCIFQDNISYYTYALLGVETLSLVVTVGTLQNILSRCITYSFYDSTREMAYIPLDKELKTKGKAAVDLVGTRLGKSGGALIQSCGLIIFHTSNLIDAIPYLMVIFALICLLWIWAVVNLSKEYSKIVAN